MSPHEVLRSSEKAALRHNQIISHVSGKPKKITFKGRAKAVTAGGFITAMIAVALILFGGGNLIPAAISDRLIEETDVQYADATESKFLAFQNALYATDIPADQNAIPDNTVARLKNGGVLVGYEANDEFIEDNKGGHTLALKYKDKIISAENFVNYVHSDAKFYEIFNNATYSRAAYYYDESAKAVFKRIGTSRNNYDATSEYADVMSKLVGEGNNVDVNNVVLVEVKDEDGNTHLEYRTVGENAKVKEAEDFIEAVRVKNPAATKTESALNSADAINVADTVAKEQRSSSFFLAFIENISKMKAGDGNTSKINEAMNMIYETSESNVVDVNTGEVVTVKGSMLESPSLYAMLSGEKINPKAVENYSSDRILKTVQNKVEAKADNGTLSGTVSSTTSKIRSSIGRFINSGGEVADSDTLSAVAPTVTSSLIDNSYSTVKGIAGGELLVEGAVNVGRMLAYQSGATTGDDGAVKSYARVQNSILALDAKVDRMNRSPFDITSKNTFLGSIVYKVAMMGRKKGTIFNSLASFSKLTMNSIAAILPATYADDENTMYLTNFGECETLNNIGAVGSAGCSVVATFDTSTLNNPFQDAGFISFMNENTTLENGVRKIKDGSTLAQFILYNDERITPNGVMDGGILNSLMSGSNKIPFISNIITMIKIFLGASEGEKRIASGAAFVNSDSNGDWETYKYAQRYVSLARATAALRQYDGDTTAYTNMKYFEGAENPVVAFINEHNNVANR